MQIKVEKLGKKFRNEWIFRNFEYTFRLGQSYAVTGSNGSGKSTLLQILAGFIPYNEGNITYFDISNNSIPAENIFKSISFTSPPLELIEDFTLAELVEFHLKLKPFENNLTKAQFINLIGYNEHSEKQLKYFSSGMKQKLKLSLCLFSTSKLLFLDEPTTNLDEQTKKWFLENINFIKQNKLIILASNDPKEYSFSDHIIDIQEFKNK
jgi:ABC-type multidrug transport system ATPase subunit